MLAVGVEPREEADAVVESLARGGFELTDRDSAATVVALAFRNRERGGTALRIVTKRGIALAIDVPPDENAEPVGLVEDAVREGRGAGAEVFLYREDPVRERRCHAALRVTSEGFVRPIVAETSAWGESACIEGIRDVDGDGEPEGIVVWRIEDGGVSPAPSVEVPLSLGEERFETAPSRYATFFDEQRAGRHLGLAAARGENDVVRALPRAIELAAIARVRGATMEEQVRAFDAALSGFVLTEAEADAIREARAHIAAGW